MKLHRIALSLSPLVFCLALPASQHAQDEGAKAGGLRRVEPSPDEALPTPGASARFDPEEWLGLLEERDLDRREGHFERLVKRARKDPSAQTFLEELSQDGNFPDLAWTARLALRELRQRPGFAVAPLDEFFGGPGQGRLEELLPDFQVFRLDPDRLFPPGSQSWFNAPGTSSESRRVTVEETGDGCTIRVTENVNGEEVNREYSGESYESILESNPELRDELTDSRMGGLRVHLGDKPLGELFQFGPLRFGDEGRPRIYFSQRGLSPEPMRTDILGVRVRPVPAERAAALGIEQGTGMLIDSVFPRTIAHALNLRSGDVILSVAGTKVASAEDITRLLAERETSDFTVGWIDADGVRHEANWASTPSAGTNETKNERRDF